MDNIQFVPIPIEREADEEVAAEEANE